MSFKVLLQALLVGIVCALSAFASETVTCAQTVKSDDSSPVTVSCPLTGEGEIKWSKDGKEVVTVEKKYSVDATNKSLTIVKIGKDFMGDYVCSDSTSNATVSVCVHPHVDKYDKPKNVIEGDPFQTECNAWGYPMITVVWTSEKNFSGAEDRTFIKNGSQIGSVLRIEKVQYEDSGFYTCIVSNQIGASNATIEVNVKDKLAALWPFLGICAEVAVLCIIIFFYERRRAKNLEKEAQSEETDRMTANNDAKVSDDVRQRK